MKAKAITLQERFANLQGELLCSRSELQLVKTELETIKKYVLTPVVSLQIALERTTDCVTHALADLKRR